MLRFFKILLGGLPDRIRRAEDRLRLITQHQAAMSLAFDEHRRETRTMLTALSLPDPSLWRNQPPLVPGQPAENAFPAATMCRQSSFEEPYFSFWTARLGEALRYHRKLWEFVFICQALWERGAVKPGLRGLGFGVGLEPLPAFFASEGCEVVATDLSPDAAAAEGWIQSSQHAMDKAALRRPQVCPDDLFEQNVSMRQCDMNAIPSDLVDFDFCWSACALEHLGSIERGLDFIVNSVACLKPGGWAVHTTEFNVSSDTETVDNMSTVLFRRSDLEDLATRLNAAGHHAAVFDFEPGTKPVDVYIDLPPYRAEPHLTVALMGYATTSIGVIVQRGAA
ncbi:class I SAM-dependent methyltransferase [Brevundimonas sp.]|uniref:class I SAM-dependent methyltransferase n=1 Tax=Brevundimonas sp. TaxID=1871086 RepID=UPI00286BC6AF|nr:class I SAM-dependent methyltransferase [Brevundimonas sp.]